MERLYKTEDKKPTFLRDLYKKKLEELSKEDKKEKIKKINQFLLKLPFLKEPSNSRYIAFYKALKQEPCLAETYSQFKNKACFPVIQDDKLEFYINPKNEWKKGPFQIEEPLKLKKNKVSLKDISLFFIPGSCFDHQGFRIGKGFGYYDKTLSQIKKTDSKTPLKLKPLFIGVAFLEQVQNKALPIKAHDVKMGFLVTDQFVLCPLEKTNRTQKNKGRLI